MLEQVRIGPRDRVLVLGDGKLGQLLSMLLLDQGLTVTLSGNHDRKLELARAAGAQTCAPEELARKSFDVVIEATGSPSGMQRALELVRPRGTLVLKSTYHGPLSFDAAPLVIDEITLVGSRCGPFAPALASLAAGGLPVERPCVGHHGRTVRAPHTRIPSRVNMRMQFTPFEFSSPCSSAVTR